MLFISECLLALAFGGVAAAVYESVKLLGIILNKGSRQSHRKVA